MFGSSTPDEILSNEVYQLAVTAMHEDGVPLLVVIQALMRVIEAVIEYHRGK